MFSTKSQSIVLYQFFFEKLFFSKCLFDREETQTSWSELSLWHRQTVHVPVVSFSFALFFLNISEVVKKCLEYWKKALLLILLAKTFANFAFDLLSVGKIYPSPQICFTILRKKKGLCRKWFEEEKKFDFITPKRLRENICPQRLLLLSEGNPLCLYYRLVKENRSSWLRTNNRPDEISCFSWKET